ncbi:cell wall hydrolase [Paracoccus sp. (in: a-proteobacteria)]|uniref:cell wall hydrolase n=1 Tax=Paracoccus sp. TaxID=267 RepID=UPI0026E001DC|nr:cell wall hydrolase [Paracoccus sp. (in: a-proteobacteria)]MDO5369502.1 cell wall hydrolase [Paracoccus sp. (in: a-proteobacteria)]
MSKLLKRLAQVAVCFALALPTLSDEAFAQNARGAAGGPERVIQAKAGGASKASLQCLTEALYHEARGESVKGQRAVAEVILNRVDHPAFPSSVCGVINQPKQFSYKGKVGRMRDRAAAQRAQRIATEALAGAPRSLTGGATYFHTTYVKPSWAKRFTRTTRIGAHIFYRRADGQRVASN